MPRQQTLCSVVLLVQVVVVVHRVKVCQALARAQLLGHQLDPELQAGILKLVSKELNHFGVIADLFRQIGGHSSRFLLFCSF